MDIKKIGIVMLIVVSIGLVTPTGLLATYAVPVQTANISISDGSADTGNTTTVTIAADDVTDFANFDITVTYDPAVVNVTDAANDVAFGTAINNLENAAAGTVRLASFNLGAGQTGDGILLSTLTMEAVGTAVQTSTLTLTINELKTSSEDNIIAATDDGMFTITGPVVSISDGSADTGNTTTVTITADDVTDFANFDITVTYDPAVVNVTDAANDVAFGTAINNLENAAAGTVRLASFNLGAGQTGDGILLSTLTMEAVGTAVQTSTLTLTINELKISSEDNIIAATDDGMFTVTGEVAIATTGDIVINEIMYDPDGRDKLYEWIELHNNDTEEINVDGWILNGTLGGSNTILSGTMTAGSYLLIARNVTAFQERYDVTCPTIKGNWSALRNTGDTIKLWDSIPTLIDTVAYTKIASVNHTAERNAADCWEEGPDGGTPCAENSVLADVD